MPTASPLRSLSRALLLLPFVLLYGCSDDSTPLAPRSDIKPLATLAPVVTVMNTDDAGTGSLRQAIIDAPDGAVIQFDAGIAGQTIVLTTGQLQIAKPLTIEGPLPAGMTISGGHVSRILSTSSTAELTLRNLSFIHGNDLQVGGGGGVLFMNGKVFMDHVLLSDNQSVWTGGAIFVKGGAELTIVNSTLSGNVGGTGGAIENDGTLTLWNSTVVNNRAIGGGGIISHGSGGEGAVFLRNSIIANNVDDNGSSNCRLLSGAVIHLAGRNLSNDNTCGTDPSLLEFDPMLGPLANNGGPTMTHALLVGSLGIDSGTDCSEASDQRYVARNQGASCDLGAFEFDAFLNATLKISPNVALNSKSGVATVTGTMSCPAAGSFSVIVTLSQTQKTTGRFSTIVQGTTEVSFVCNGTSSWSATVTPTAGKFVNGAASGQASPRFYPAGYLRPADASASLKLFQLK